MNWAGLNIEAPSFTLVKGEFLSFLLIEEALQGREETAAEACKPGLLRAAPIGRLACRKDIVWHTLFCPALCVPCLLVWLHLALPPQAGSRACRPCLGSCLYLEAT